MTLQQLEYILAVNQFRHFAKAAEYCRVKQPTLSAMIQKLEEELDTRIFDRSQQPVCPTPIGIHIIEQAQNVLVQANRIKNIIEEEKHSLTGTFNLGILPTIAPYLLPRFFPQLMKKYPGLDIRVVEMKTNDIKKALQTGEVDAGIVASLAGMEEFQQTALFYEQFFAYVAREDALSQNEVIRTSDLNVNGEQLWLLDEGHCFRDQLVRFCQMKAARTSQLAYHLGSMETFMRMVESGKGVTFIPELAVLQLSEIQKELVRPFAIPCPTRQIVMLTNKNFIRYTLLETLTKEIQSAVPKEMLSLRATQIAV
jgi:LysR family hydrogen peroxide-inducible transcriptional activator